MDAATLSTGLAAVLAAMTLGGGAYEARVVDAAWPGNPSLIQPLRGGLDRKRFWIAMHGAFEAALLWALWAAWDGPAARGALLVALGSHAAMRLWSFVDLIPRALAFERAEPWSVEGPAALAWVRRSRARLPLDLLCAAACLWAFAAA